MGGSCGARSCAWPGVLRNGRQPQLPGGDGDLAPGSDRAVGLVLPEPVELLGPEPELVAVVCEQSHLRGERVEAPDPGSFPFR